VTALIVRHEESIFHAGVSLCELAATRFGGGGGPSSSTPASRVAVFFFFFFFPLLCILLKL